MNNGSPVVAQYISTQAKFTDNLERQLDTSTAGQKFATRSSPLLSGVASCGLAWAGHLMRSALHLLKKHGPWKVLCDSENFLHSASSRSVMAAEGIPAWRARRRIRPKDREGLQKRRLPLPKGPKYLYGRR